MENTKETVPNNVNRRTRQVNQLMNTNKKQRRHGNNSESRLTNVSDKKSIPRGTSKNECSPNNSETKNVDLSQQIHRFLDWGRCHRPIPIEVEQKLLSLLMQYGKQEHGMFKNQKPHRIRRIKQACYDNGMRLDQALSLRRHHIQVFNPYKPMPRLGLGSDQNIHNAATIFEEVVSKFLSQSGIEFWDEEEQRNQHKERCKQDPKVNMPPTPDFLFPSSVHILKNGIQSEINWIDAKMFYGASTIEKSNNAVGSLHKKAKKYVDKFGRGAFIFYNGYGDGLEALLLEENVILLDAFASPVELRCVFEHQQTWCANNDGEILP